MRCLPPQLVFLLVVALNVRDGARAADPVEYNRDIRPLLAAKCLACHGPDEKERQADLRLDDSASARADRGGYAVIVPGEPDTSVLMERITSTDDAVRMPPPESGKRLSESEIQRLRAWIAGGADVSPHWAFIPPQRPAPPEVRHPESVRNPVDQFVLARMEGAGLAPSAQADAHALVRRVSLDLIGLPPLPEEVDEFLADTERTSFDAAYERWVDRLLNSPRYGERWARAWLDLARYADTNGYEKDRERQVWAFRDWVIEALNRDLPFDQFTIEQLAGDLLPDATLTQRVATGFHRNTLLNEEGGIDPLEFRFYAMCDRVATTGATWLGLTMQCCQCHNHKYDPVSQREFYALMALLNNTDDVEQALPDPQAEERYRANLAEAERLLAELPRRWPLPDAGGDEPSSGDGTAADEAREQAISRRFTEWLADQRSRAANWRTLRPLEMSANEPILTLEEDNTIFVSGDITKHDEYQLRFANDLEGATAIRLEALPDDRLPGGGPGLTYYEGEKGDFFLSEFQLQVDDRPVAIASASQSHAANQFGDNPVSAQLATDGDLQTGWSIYGRLAERHTAVFDLAHPLPKSSDLRVTMHFGRHFASSLGRFRIAVTTNTTSAALDLPVELEELLLKPDDSVTAVERERLRQEFLLAAPELKDDAAKIRELRVRPRSARSLVLRERPADNPRRTHLHVRGEYLRAGDAVDAGTPAALPPFPADQPRTRLGLARWLVSAENPLTARVVVNRQWAALFGAGIVRTVEDFGVQGTPPSNQPLLDWLAVEFVERGWSLKQLHRLLVTSATYRQSSRSTPELLSADPNNEFLARMPRRRLEAEAIRDATLRAAGLLSEKMGGPGVRPPQPAGITELTFGSPTWAASEGEDRYRRGIYTFIKRTAPFAAFQTFDAPSGLNCTARRDVSNSPLQALTLLNDVAAIEAAQALGRMIAERSGDDAKRSAYAFRRVLTRPPGETELRELTRFLTDQRRRLAAGELDGSAIAGGHLDDVPAEAIQERAAWTTLARALLSLDEAITRN